jgi:hypothetical protein
MDGELDTGQQRNGQQRSPATRIRHRITGGRKPGRFDRRGKN